MKSLGVYIHIPFCKSKCYYCDFTSFANQQDKVSEYIYLLKQEIRNSEKYNADTIYIGGGTPSFIDDKYIKEILEELNYEKPEITIEVNPGTVNENKLKNYFNMGVNRLSIGLQSTNNELLKEIGRVHNYSDFVNTYESARKIGFKNINIDIIIGLPNQTIDIVNETLDRVLEFAPEHISIYSLILEENTVLETLVNKSILKLPDDNLERQMYWLAKNRLEMNGYIHYEISNFAKKGYFSKHNVNCWNQEEYIGYGLGAHSYIGNIRFCNTSDMNLYMKSNKIINEIQTEYTKMQEYVMLGLRKIEGISVSEFYNKFNKDIFTIFKNEIEKLLNLNLIEKEGQFIRLSKKGIDLANIVWEEFI